MQIDRGDRIAPSPSPERSGPWVGAIVAVAAALALALVAFPDLRDILRREAYTAAGRVGAPTPADDYAPVFERLEIAPVPAGLVVSPKVSAPLAKLLREPCDKRAIGELAAGLTAEGEERLAARSYRGFAAACPDSAEEKGRAGELFLRVGDTDTAIAIAEALISEQPAASDFHYFRARALAAAKRYDAAVAAFKTTIELFHDRRLIPERVFLELANAQIAVGKPCEAVAAVLSFVALDPPRRATAGARKRMEEYSALGCRNPPTLEAPNGR